MKNITRSLEDLLGKEYMQAVKSVAVQIYSLDDTELAKDYFNCLNEGKDPYRLKYYEDKFLLTNSNFVFKISEQQSGKVLLDSTNNSN